MLATIDQSQIEGALVNLCLNAVDATPNGGRIEVRSRADRNRLLLEVQNSGPKIALDNLGQVFEPFFTTKPGGTGLGLAIARAAAVAHGGDLYVSKNEDGMVVFTLELSASQVNEALNGKGVGGR
jgi:signal transduction histidine kinase